MAKRKVAKSGGGILGHSGSVSRRKSFGKAIKGATSKGDERALEVRHLQPAPLVKRGKGCGDKKPSTLELRIFFKKEEDLELFKKYLRVNEYRGFNTHDVELLVKLLTKYLKKNKKGETLLRKRGKGWIKQSKKKLSDG